MGGWCVRVEEDRENSVSTCGCKDANARLDECCLWECGARLCSVVHVKKNAMPRRSKMRDCQECRSVPVQCMDRRRSGRRKCNGRPPTIARRRGGCARGCTSLPCTSGTVRTLCPVNPRTGIREQNGNGTEQRQRARSHISSRVWSYTCSNRCLARCGCL